MLPPHARCSAWLRAWPRLQGRAEQAAPLLPALYRSGYSFCVPTPPVCVRPACGRLFPFGPFAPLKTRLRGDAGIELVRLGDGAGLFWHKSNSNDPDRNVWSIFVFSLGFRPRRTLFCRPGNTHCPTTASKIVRKVSHFRLSHK